MSAGAQSVDDVAHGFVAPRFAAVRPAFAANLQSGADVGASFCVIQDGETVVDLWGGWADAARTRPWTRDTLANAYSATKTVAALVPLWLADRGELDLDAPIARYWPAFAANGKAQVTTRQALSHSAGLPHFHAPVARTDLYDWEKMTGLLAAQAPEWTPGEACGYHSITYAHLLGEVARRITGRSIGTLIREVFAQPLGADFHVGLPASEDHRVAEMIAPAHEPLALAVDVADTATRAWRGAELPAIGGTGNARGLATLLSVLANGGEAMGQRFVSEAGARRVLEARVEERDRILQRAIRWGLGFAVSGGFPNPNTAFWGGYGGSFALVDYDARTAIAFVMNRMSPSGGGDLRGLGLAMAAWEAQGLI